MLSIEFLNKLLNAMASANPIAMPYNLSENSLY